MSGWTENTLLKYMQIDSKHFGKEMLQIIDAKQEWICRKFTEKLFDMLDWTQVIDTPYVDVRYCGQGDVESMRVKKDFCLTPKQCANIANFIAGRIQKNYERSELNDLLSFAILNYIQKGIPLNTDYIRILRLAVEALIERGGMQAW